MVVPPKYSVSILVGTIKTNTSKLLGEKFSFLDKVYWDDKGMRRILCSHGGNKRGNDQKIRRIARKGRCRTSAA